MASVYDLKPKFQDLLRTIVIQLANRGVSANQVTVAAMVLSVGTGWLIIRYSANRSILLLLPLVLFVRMALNAIDGMLAREHDMKTPLGAILNELGDVVSDAALYLPLAAVSIFSPMLMILIVILAIISEMTGVIGIQIGASRRYDGPMGKSDRAFVFGTVGFLAGVGILPESWVLNICRIILVLLIVTIINRSRKALAEIGAQS